MSNYTQQNLGGPIHIRDFGNGNSISQNPGEMCHGYSRPNENLTDEQLEAKRKQQMHAQESSNNNENRSTWLSDHRTDIFSKLRAHFSNCLSYDLEEFGKLLPGLFRRVHEVVLIQVELETIFGLYENETDLQLWKSLELASQKKAQKISREINKVLAIVRLAHGIEKLKDTKHKNDGAYKSLKEWYKHNEAKIERIKICYGQHLDKDHVKNDTEQLPSEQVWKNLFTGDALDFEVENFCPDYYDLFKKQHKPGPKPEDRPPNKEVSRNIGRNYKKVEAFIIVLERLLVLEKEEEEEEEEEDTKPVVDLFNQLRKDIKVVSDALKLAMRSSTERFGSFFSRRQESHSTEARALSRNPAQLKHKVSLLPESIDQHCKHLRELFIKKHHRHRKQDALYEDLISKFSAFLRTFLPTLVGAAQRLQ